MPVVHDSLSMDILPRQVHHVYKRHAIRHKAEECQIRCQGQIGTVTKIGCRHLFHLLVRQWLFDRHIAFQSQFVERMQLSFKRFVVEGGIVYRPETAQVAVDRIDL